MPMLSDDAVKTASAMAYYEGRAEALLPTYDQVTFEDIHRGLLKLLPEAPRASLDVGAGSGRDAACGATGLAPRRHRLETTTRSAGVGAGSEDTQANQRGWAFVRSPSR
jgi:hypothetical protein